MVETDNSGPGPTVRRRRYLVCCALAAGLAGCRSGDNNTTTTPATTTSTTSTTTTTVPSTTTSSTTTPQPADCSSPTELSRSDLNGGATLSAGCYRVAIRYEDSVEITDGTLRLEPGVTIQFANNDGLDFHDGGRLVAQGTADAPVRLTGVEDGRGAWRGLRFRNSGSNRNHIERTIIENAGGRAWHGGEQSKAGVFVQGSGRLTLQSTTIRENQNVGLTVGNSDGEVDVRLTLFERNDLPVWINADHAGSFAESNAFEANDQSYIRVGVSGSRTGVTSAVTWRALGVPYRATRTIVVRSPLQVQPATTIEFQSNDHGFDVRDGGQLTAQGTPSLPIRFTARADERGAWQGLRFFDTGSSQNLLEHVFVENAGGRQWHGGEQSQAGVFVQGDSARLTARNVTIRQNQNAGLSVGGDNSRIAVENTLFEGNAVPIWVNAEHVGDLDLSNGFENNDQSYVRVGVAGSRTGVTRESTWNDLGVPYRITRHLWSRSPLAVQEGTTLEFEQGVGMRIQGTELTADATSQNPIVLAGVEPEQGYWLGLSLDGTSVDDVLLSNVVIAGGGRNRWHGGQHSQANLFLFGNSVDADPNGPRLDPAGVEIHDSVVRGSGKHGISKAGNAQIAGCDGMSYGQNAGSDTYDMGRNGPIRGC